MLLVCHTVGLSSTGGTRTTWFSVHSSIIQLLDKYSSQGSNGSLQGQQHTRSCNAKHLPQPLPASPLVYHCLPLPLPASSGLLLSPPAPSLPSSFCFLWSIDVSPCLPLFPFRPSHPSGTFLGTKGRMPVRVTVSPLNLLQFKLPYWCHLQSRDPVLSPQVRLAFVSFS